MNIKEALGRIVAQLDLTTEEMQAVMREIMTGQCTDAQIGAFQGHFVLIDDSNPECDRGPARH